MSAVLTPEQADQVVADIELLKDIRRATADLRDAEIGVHEPVGLTFSTRENGRDLSICFVNGGSPWLANVALQAMEREVKARLASKDIEVQEAA